MSDVNRSFLRTLIQDLTPRSSLLHTSFEHPRRVELPVTVAPPAVKLLVCARPKLPDAFVVDWYTRNVVIGVCAVDVHVKDTVEDVALPADTAVGGVSALLTVTRSCRSNDPHRPVALTLM